jgi:prepilin-type N-terminal cleavage/methylation domain-containing protein
MTTIQTILTIWALVAIAAIAFIRGATSIPSSREVRQGESIGGSMKKQRGFTVVEILAVLITLSVIAGACGAIYIGLHFIAKFW